jgi:hypothetical protein
MSQCTGFFAYPTVPASCGDAIESAVEQINVSHSCNISTWKSMKFSGKEGVHEICQSIEAADFFCADLTGINPNVMFELGYAIAKNKRVWLIADTTYSDSRHELQALNVLTTIGHCPYTNASQIITGFYKDSPQSSLEGTLWNQEIAPILDGASIGTLFHLKPLFEDQAALTISQFIRKAKIRTIVDDPREIQAQPLSWYAQQIYRAAGVICHFTGPKRSGAAMHNPRLALACGIAHGLSKNLVMLTEENFLAPFDYRMLLRHYHTSQDAQNAIEEWMPNVLKESVRLVTESQSEKDIHDFEQGLTALQELKFGEYMAENDSSLEKYFIETPEYEEAKSGVNRLFVGRKGTGKTANLLTLAADLKREPNNLVVIINPEGYQMDGLVAVLKKYVEPGDKSYVVESLWKFLLFTELANVLCDEFEIDAAHGNVISQVQQELLDLLGSKGSDLRQEFAIRLERTVQKILVTAHSDTIEAHRYAITETLHKEILGKLKKLLPPLLGDRSIAILVDNLDKAWDPFVGSKLDLQSICKILLGLLTSVRSLNFDFDKETRERRKKRELKTSIAAFLRADIYHKILEMAPEPDKLQPVKLRWDDPELLMRVIDERLLTSIGKKWTPAAANVVWSKFFPADVEGVPTKEFILRGILPRPRDIVSIVKFAVSNALKRKHPKVWSMDLTDAHQQYSEFALSTIIAEYPEFGGMQYEFMGCESILTEDALAARIVRSGQDDSSVPAVIEVLTSLSFLGVETNKGEFRFAEDPGQFKKLDALAKNYVERIATKSRRYKIHSAFERHLETVPSA